jgi:hypothetical protein
VAVSKRRGKSLLYDVSVKIHGKQVRLAVVDNVDYAYGISELSREILVSPNLQKSNLLFALRAFCPKAYETLCFLDASCSLDKLADDIKRDSIDFDSSLSFLAKQRAKEMIRDELTKYDRLVVQSLASPVPIAYPDVPPPCIELSRKGEGLPCEPGIYFLWNQGECQYVGRSTNLNRRVRDRHENALMSDLASWIVFPESEIFYAECFYIGLVRPVRNYKSGGLSCKEAS